MGAILGVVLACIWLEFALANEQAMEQEIRQRIADGEDAEEAKMHAIMGYKMMPIAPMGFITGFGIAACFGGFVGGVVTAVIWHSRPEKDLKRCQT